MKTFKVLTRIALLIICLSGTESLLAETWPSLRDGVVHIRHTAETPSSFLVKWDDAWISESQEDHAFLLGPKGELLEKIELTALNTPGKLGFQIEGKGDYRFEVTGASFRNVSIGTQGPTPMVFEPVKIHKSISLPRSGHFYFKAPANTPFTFNAKFHDGVTDFSVRPVDATEAYTLKLVEHTLHWQFDKLEIPASLEPVIYEVSWSGRGKASFWLDGIDNLFSLRPEDWFVPEYSAGNANIIVTDSVMGTSPAIGAALPYVDPPAFTWPVIESWQLGAANYYLFADTLAQKPDADIAFLTRYEQQFNIESSNSILADTGRNAVLEPTPELKNLITHYLKQRQVQGLLKSNYFAFADEPNLNYPDYETFEHYVSELITAIEQHPDPDVAKTHIAVPQSSRFLHGPTRTQADRRKGIDWADKLLGKMGASIDAISWHEWLVRDLIDTPRYRKAVEQAAALVERHAKTNGHQQKLIIGQTNISSGSSLSPYEQDTFFAALWWTSVVIQSSLPGKLDQIMWFKAADDEIYKKGLISLSDASYSEKPVSKAMQFINKNVCPLVVKLENNRPELDLLVTLSDDRKKASILGVNKSKRTYSLGLQLPFAVQNLVATALTHSGTDALATAVAESQNSVTSEITGETIFSIQMDIMEQKASTPETSTPAASMILGQPIQEAPSNTSEPEEN